MGLRVIDIVRTGEIDACLREVYATPGPVLCNVEINPNQKLYPVVKFGSPLEDQLPALDPEFIAREMIVPPAGGGTDGTAGTPGV